MINAAIRCAIGLIALLFAGPSWAATTVQSVGTDPTQVVVKGTLVTPDQVMDGELVIDGDTNTCVAATCTAPAGATRITVTNAYILPGFVDAHNHVAYNILQRWTPPKLYKEPRHGGTRWDTQHREEEANGEDVTQVERAGRECGQGEARHKSEEGPRQYAGRAGRRSPHRCLRSRVP